MVGRIAAIYSKLLLKGCHCDVTKQNKQVFPSLKCANTKKLTLKRFNTILWRSAPIEKSMFVSCNVQNTTDVANLILTPAFFLLNGEDPSASD